MDSYCKLFVSPEESIEEIALHLSHCVGGKIELTHYLENENLELDIRRNKEHLSTFSEDIEEEAQFLFFPLTIDIDKQKNVSIDAYINDISKVIRCLQSVGFNVVAACDFEDLLLCS